MVANVLSSSTSDPVRCEEVTLLVPLARPDEEGACALFFLSSGPMECSLPLLRGLKQAVSPDIGAKKSIEIGNCCQVVCEADFDPGRNKK